MTGLPAGTVTFLFTDIEGSTRLLHELGDRYAEVLTDHRRLLREVFEDCGGREVDTQGDSFFVAFGDAGGAVRAAADGQRALAGHPWPENADVRVRMGVHTGEPLIAGDHYVGIDVHRGARIAAAAYGGQVLISSRTSALVQSDGALVNSTLRELGAYALKDLPEPERLFQLVVDGLPATFPPPRVHEKAPAAAGLPDYSLPPADVPCPYKGLVRFEPEDSDLFFGREELVSGLVTRLGESAFLAVVGPSGSGKSSLVRAGVVPELERRREFVQPAIVEPGEHPLPKLDVAQDADLIVVDQFEELFTLCRDEDERLAFVDRLLDAAEEGTRIVVVLRADFYGHCASYVRLAAALEDRHALIGPMTEEELRRAIERPAERAGLALEPGLAEGMLHDLVGEPGALPLLSHCLLETWRRRSDRMLTLLGYLQSGGVRGAIAKTAETVYREELAREQQALARNIFLRLTELGEGTEDTRRRVRLSELAPRREQAADVDEVLRMLVEARLVTTGEGTVEVAHEALIRHWPTLRAWLDEDREGRLVHSRLTEAAQEWQALGKDPGALYRGTRLAAAAEWAGLHDDELNELEREFLAASREAELSEVEAAKRRNRRLRTLVAALAVLLLGAVVAGAYALVQRHDAREAATSAEAQRLGAQGLVEDDLDRSLLLARAGVGLDDSVQTEGNLLAALLRSPAAVGVMQGDGDRLLELDLSPDGQTLAVADNNGTVVFLDPKTRRRVGDPLQVSDTVLGLVFTPDGSRLVIAGGVGPRGFVRLYDTRSRALRPKLPVTMEEAEAPAETAVSPDGGMIVARLFTDTPEPEKRKARVVRWNARTGKPLGQPVEVAKDAFPGGLAFTSDGNRLLIGGGGRLTVWDARSMTRIRSFPGDAFSIAAAPDDRTVAFGARDGTVTFLDLSTGVQRKGGGRHAASVQGVAFSPDGKTLVSTGDDRNVIVWDVASGTPRETLEGHAGRVHAQDFSPDGRTVYTASLDARVIAWDIEGSRRIGRPLSFSKAAEANIAAAAGPDGQTFATVAEDGSIRLRRFAAGSVVGKPLRGFRGNLVWLALSPDGRTAAAVGVGGPGVLWDTRTGGHRTLRGWTAERSGWVSFSPDGQTLVTGGTEVSLWNVATGKRVADFQAGGYMSEASLSPDGKLLATAGEGGQVIIWDVDERKRITSFQADEVFASTARFSPDGKLLATGGETGNALLWDTDTWRPVGRPLAGHAGFVITVGFDEDGATLVTSSTDGNVRLWDVASGRQIGAGLPGPGNRWSNVMFVPGVERLLAVYDTGTALIWDVDPARWKRQACTVAGRNLTRDEWSEFLPGRAYGSVCS